MYKILSKREYKVGDILVFKGESCKFKHGKQYKISQKSIVDYAIDDLDMNYGNECLYFEDTNFGCFAVYADDNFVTINEYRDEVINNILNNDRDTI